MTSSVVRREPTATREIAGREVALGYGPIESEYAALRSGALLVDRSHRTRMTFEGDKGAETLTGLVTNDVASLAAGSGQYAAGLTPRGKIIADVRIFARQTDLLVDVPVRASAGWLAMVRKFVNPRATRYADVTGTLSDIAVVGPGARAVVAQLTGVSSETLAAFGPYAHTSVDTAYGGALIARVPDVGVEAYEAMLPASARDTFWQHAIDLGAAPGGLEAWEVARVEAGRPEWGVDIDDATIPQEANFDELHAISYTKGCYTGQETVARVHFRGHVNRHLRGLQFDAASGVATGAQLVDDSGKVVGDVRSTAVSPRLGGIALAMVRREITPGTTVNARWDGGEAPVAVLTLPFPP